MPTLLFDCRRAIQSLRRDKIFTTVAVTTLALAIGANTTVFNLAYGALLRPLPFPESDRLMMPYITATEAGRGTFRERWSYPRYQLLRRFQTQFSDVGTFGPASFNLTGTDQAERVSGEVVSAAYFAILRVPAWKGRTFTSEEDSIPGAHAVAVLSYGLWRQRFGADTAIVGQSIRIEGREFHIDGIMPPGFEGLTGHAELWIPEAMAPLLTYRDHLTTNQNFISLVARLRPGASFPSARTEMALLGPRIQREQASEADGPTIFGATVVPLEEARIDPANRQALLVLLGAVALVLAVAAANLTHLQLARALGNRREFAVQLALGAGRGRLVRQVLVESALVATAATVVGALVSAALSVSLRVPSRAFGPRGFYGQLGEFASAPFDLRTLLYSCGVGAVAIALFGLLPALRATRLDVAHDLKSGSESATRGKVGRWLGMKGALVVAEIALSSILAIGATLMAQSVRQLQGGNRGIDDSHLLTFRIQPSEARYTTLDAPALIERLLGTIGSVPGVVSATVDAGTPFDNTFARSTLYIAGRPVPRPDQAPPVTRHYVGPEHFRTLGIPLLRGRTFKQADRAGRPGVAIINRTAAARFWPGRSPIGESVWFGGGSPFSRPDSSVEIVGVVGDVPYGSLEDAGSQASFYTPYLQFSYPGRTFMVRTIGDPLNLLASIRAALQAAEPELPLYDPETMEDRLVGSFAKPRFNAALLGTFATIALLFAMIGVYGVLAHGVRARTKEIGIRAAVGGAPQQILALILGQGLRLTLMGIGLGILGAIGLVRVLQSLLYGVSVFDPISFTLIPGLIVAVAFLAALIPARRATRVDPMRALRVD